MTMPEGSSAPPPGGYPGAVPPGPEASYPQPGPSGPPPSYPPAGPQPGYPPPGPPTYSDMPPARPVRGRRTGLIALGVLVVLVVLIVGALALFRDRISGDVNSLVVGDCIDDPQSTSAISAVQHQPCPEPHDGEVFAVLTYPGADGAAYPGTSAFESFVRDQCLTAVQSYTGRSAAEIAAAGLSYAFFYPTSDSWTGSNDRGVTCYVERTDLQKMVGSVRSAGASSQKP